MTNQAWSVRHAPWLMMCLLVGSTVFHVIFITQTDLDLFPDEAQYWDWSRHPDWSYYSKPPLVAYTILAARAVLGESTPFAVRLPAAIIGGVTTYFIYRLASLVAGNAWAGLLAALAFRSMPLVASESVAMTTDTLLLLFWAAGAVCLYRAFIQEQSSAWLEFGVAMMLGVLSKYTMLVMLTWAAGMLWASPSPTTRKPRTPALALMALFLTAAALVPPLVWNAEHDWASFRHLASSLGKPGHFQFGFLSTMSEFLAGQVLVVTPVLWGCMLWAIVVSWRRWRNEGSQVDLFLLWGALPTFLMYLGASALGRCEPNWPAPAYVAGLAALARHACPGRQQLIGLALLGALPFTLIAYDFDLVYAVGLPLQPHRDPTVRLRGWKELGAAVGVEVARMGQRRGGQLPLVIGTSYQVTAELAFYVPGQPVAYCANLGRRRNQYDYWPSFSSRLGCDAVLVMEGDCARPPELLRSAFTRVDRAPSVVFSLHGQPVKRFSLFRLYAFQGMRESEGGRF